MPWCFWKKLQINASYMWKGQLTWKKTKLQQKGNKIAKLDDESRIHIEEEAAAVKRDEHKFTEHLMAVAEAKEKELLNKVELQVNESRERLRTQQRVVDKEVKLIVVGIGKTETLIERSTSAEAETKH